MRVLKNLQLEQYKICRNIPVGTLTNLTGLNLQVNLVYWPLMAICENLLWTCGCVKNPTRFLRHFSLSMDGCFYDDSPFSILFPTNFSTKGAVDLPSEGLLSNLHRSIPLHATICPKISSHPILLTHSPASAEIKQSSMVHSFLV